MKSPLMMLWLPGCAATSFVAFVSASSAQSPVEVPPIEEVTITEQRVGRSHAELHVTRIGPGNLGMGYHQSLDELIGRDPAIGLFRRASSLSAHPTTQGMTLRGVGPNGAGRALVMLDGIPLNDGFGGWVYWQAVPEQSLGDVTITHGGGAGSWGNQAISGVIAMTSRTPIATGARVRMTGGNYGTRSLAGAGDVVGDGYSLSLYGRFDDSDGFYLLDQAQRGPVDVPAARQTTSIGARLTADVSSKTKLALGAQYFDEARVNGLSLAANHTESKGLNASITHSVDARAGWQLNGYYREQDFANAFAIALDQRKQERQVLDQYAVPSTSWGANGLVEAPLGDDLDLQFGFDVRGSKGETHERFRNLGAGFTRARLAGGQQALVGVHGELTKSGEGYSLSAMVRVDHWSAKNGQRVETNTETSGIVRQDTIVDTTGSMVNGRLSGRMDMSENSQMRAALYSGFRLPTINEFYRPFRVGNDITEANPLLRPEQLIGLDVGVDTEIMGGTARLTYFRNWLNDGVGNVTLALGPGFFPPTGFVPAAGSLRQRQNIGHIVADGVELGFSGKLTEAIHLRAAYIWSRARVTGVNVGQEALTGKRLAQSPLHRGNIALDYDAGGVWTAGGELRLSSGQYEDDLNSRVLDAYISANAYVNWAWSQQLSLYGAVENAFDADIQSAISGAGIITYAQPRLLSFGVRAAF